MESPTLTKAFLDANKGPQVLAIIIIFPCLSGLVVALRLYTRIKIVNNPSWEDSSVLLALVFSIATSICQGFQVQNGMGRHIQALTIEQGIRSLKALFASIMMYNFGLTLTKVSIVLQYLRITIDKDVKKACRLLLWFIFLNCFATWITGIFTCYPVAKFWDDRIPGGCVNKPALWYANAAINILQDVVLILLPIFILRKLMMPRREKIGLCIILGLGGFASLASVLRLHALHSLTVSTDITWDNPGTATWSCMELNIGIICASLPTLRAFFGRYFPNTFTVASRSHGSEHSGIGQRPLIHHKIASRASCNVGAILIKKEIDIYSETHATFLASDSEAEIPKPMKDAAHLA